MKYTVLTLLICILALGVLSGCSGKRPSNLGLENGRLAPCPDSPNCVSTQSGDESHAIKPIPMNGSVDSVMGKVAATVQSMGGKVVQTRDNYLYVEFTSVIWRFVDDLECWYDKDNGLLHVRSASRLGYSDFGVNRKRVKKLRTLLLEHSDQPE